MPNSATATPPSTSRGVCACARGRVCVCVWLVQPNSPRCPPPPPTMFSGSRKEDSGEMREAPGLVRQYRRAFASQGWRGVADAVLRYIFMCAVRETGRSAVRDTSAVR